MIYEISLDIYRIDSVAIPTYNSNVIKDINRIGPLGAFSGNLFGTILTKIEVSLGIGNIHIITITCK